jgi:iron complex outermembrane recepter protein
VSGMGNHLIIFRVDNLLNQRYRDHLSRVAERNFPVPGRNFSLAYRLFF